jgi:hypothetical protein
MARAAYGSLRAQVIAAPEFLFANDGIIHEFWQNVSRQRFAKPSNKEPDELTDAERKVYGQISDEPFKWKRRVHKTDLSGPLYLRLQSLDHSLQLRENSWSKTRRIWESAAEELKRRPRTRFWKLLPKF